MTETVTQDSSRAALVDKGHLWRPITPATPSEWQHTMALKLLIAADFVSQAKVDEAIALAKAAFTTQELSIAGETK